LFFFAYIFASAVNDFTGDTHFAQNKPLVLYRSVLYLFENRMLRRIFGPKRDEVTGEWRKLPNEELNNLYSLPNIVWMKKSRRMRWAEHVARMGEGGGVYRILVGKPEGKRPLGRHRRRWEDNTSINRTGSSWLRVGTGGGHL
jgi:hypothetical protein